MNAKFIATKKVRRNFEIDGFFSAYRFDWNDNYAFKGESHDLWEIVFPLTGMVEVAENGCTYILEKNNMIIHAPMEFHRIKSIEKHPPTVLVMSFHANGNLPENIKEGIFALSEEDAAVYKSIFDKIFAFIHTKDKGDRTGQEAADLLSAFLIRLGFDAPVKYFNLCTGEIEYRKIISVMNEHICDNLTLSELSAKCSISVSYIKQLFGKYSSESPKKYYSQLRIQYAIRLLSEGTSVSRVAQIMNFSSPNYFAVFFKSHTGEMPSAYRKRRILPRA